MTWLLQWFALFAWKNENWKSWKTCSQLAKEKRTCYTHKKFKTSIKSWIIVNIVSIAGFELAVHNSQFVKRFGSWQICFCIFSNNCESLKSDTSWIFRVIYWTSYIVSYFKCIKYPLLNNNMIS